MPDIAVVILAAGNSSRMGSPKQLKVLNGETLLSRMIKAARASSASTTLVVLGANARLISETVDLSNTVVLQNDFWQKGMGSSIKCAIDALDSQGATAAIFASCDQPFIDATVLNALIEQFRVHNTIVASSYAGVVGIPALFPAKEFQSLKSLAPEEGAKRILRDKSKQIQTIVFEAGKYDIDTEKDWDEFTRLAEIHGSI